LWRCSDGLFFEVPPLANDTLITVLHPLLKNVLQTVSASVRRIVEQVVFLPWSSFFMVGKAQKLYGVRSGLHMLDG
jgi:hypothetical protein